MIEVRSFEVRPFRLPLVRPGPDGAIREGAVVRLETSDGIVGLGEASPAEWVGGEPLALAIAGLERVAAGAPGASLRDLERRLEELSAAARFALDCALADAEARRRGVPLVRLLGGSAEGSLGLSRLLDEEGADEVERAASAAAAAGFRAIKLKIGRRPIAEDVARARAARAGAGPGVGFRLDANRVYEEDEAAEVLERVRPLAIELVEEPLREPAPEALARLRRIGVPLALDETIASADDLVRFADAGAIDAVVVKLARVGGFAQALRIGRLAAPRRVTVVVTDSIETSIGRSAALHLAAAIVGEPRAVGLGGASRLAGDVARPSVPAAPGRALVSGPGLGVALVEAM
jgi:o-succinylbenzoate synthase